MGRSEAARVAHEVLPSRGCEQNTVSSVGTYHTFNSQPSKVDACQRCRTASCDHQHATSKLKPHVHESLQQLQPFSRTFRFPELSARNVREIGEAMQALCSPAEVKHHCMRSLNYYARYGGTKLLATAFMCFHSACPCQVSASLHCRSQATSTSGVVVVLEQFGVGARSHVKDNTPSQNFTYTVYFRFTRAPVAIDAQRG